MFNKLKGQPWLFLICKYSRQKTRWFTNVLLCHIVAVLKASSECACDRDRDKTSNLRDWDSENGKTRDQDQVSSLHHCLTCSGETNILCSKCNIHLCLNQWWSLGSDTKSRDSFLRVSVPKALNIAKKWLSKISIFQRFLFVVFAGKKQPKHVGKRPEIKKNFNSEVMTTFLKKFRPNAQILKSRDSEFLMKSRSWRLRSRLHHWSKQPQKIVSSSISPVMYFNCDSSAFSKAFKTCNKRWFGVCNASFDKVRTIHKIKIQSTFRMLCWRQRKNYLFNKKNTTTLKFLRHKMFARFQQLVYIIKKALTFVFALLSFVEILYL